MSGSLLIRNGTLMTPQGPAEADLLIEAGKISAISKSGSLSGERTIDASGKLVLPGVIDPHTELATDGLPQTLEKNLRSETPSMVTGGVTSFFTHYRAQSSYRELLPESLRRIEGNSLANVGIHAVLKSDEHVAEIPFMAEECGMTDFKFYPGPRSELFHDAWGVDDGTVYGGMTQVAKLGYPAIALAHCENWILIGAIRKTVMASGARGGLAWAESRPSFSEEETIARMVFFAKNLGCPFYVLHVTTAGGVRTIAQARSEGYDITGETMPHFLAFNKFDKLNPVGKYSPALRSPEDVEAVWQGLRSGVLSTVGSDHAVGNWRGTVATEDDVWKGRGSVYAGAGVILPVMFTIGVLAGRISLERLVEATSANPAKAFGVYPRKGALAVGSDADVVILDPRKEVVMRSEALNLSTDFTRFDGMPCKGWPVTTILSGEVMVDGGTVVGSLGSGKYLRRTVDGRSNRPPQMRRCD